MRPLTGNDPSDLESRQVRTSDGEMGIVKRLDRLELNDDQGGDEEVEPMEPDFRFRGTRSGP